MNLVYQQTLISLLKHKLKVTVKYSDEKYISPSNQLLFDEKNNLITTDIRTSQSQHATLVLAIYMNLLEGMNVSQNLLLFGDALVFSGLYNSKFNSSKFLTLLSGFKDEISNLKTTNFTISDIQVAASYYGINKDHLNLFLQLDILAIEKYNDVCRFLQQLVNDAGKNVHKIFTVSRFINMLENKPGTRLFTTKDFILLVISRLQKSEFINIYQDEPTNKSNKIVKDENTTILVPTTGQPYIKDQRRGKIDVYMDIETFEATHTINRFLYTVIMTYDYECISIYTDLTFTDNIYEAVKTAQEFEYGMVVVFPKKKLLFSNYNQPPRHLHVQQLEPTTGIVYYNIKNTCKDRSLLLPYNINDFILPKHNIGEEM